MNTIHVLSTAPWRAAYGTGTSFRMDTPEFLTLLLACLEWRSRGELYLYTDADGEDWAKEQRIAGLYTKIVRLPELKRIAPQIFWDIGKVIALEMDGANSVIADLDFVSFVPVTQSFLYIGHAEPLTWPCYANNRDRFEQYGFSYGWDWTAPAYNTCLLNITWHMGLRKEYVAWALNFAENYSEHPLKESPDWRYAPAMFAGQRLLGMVARRFGIRGLEFFKLRATHHDYAKEGFHLWNRKLVYRQCLEPRVAILNWLLDRITAHKNEDTNLLLRRYTSKSTGPPGFYRDPERQAIQANGTAALQYDSVDTPFTRTLLVNGCGAHQSNCGEVTDPCTGEIRDLFPGRHKLYTGDIVKLSPHCKAMFIHNARLVNEIETGVSPCEVGGEDEALIWAEPGGTPDLQPATRNPQPATV